MGELIKMLRKCQHDQCICDECAEGSNVKHWRQLMGMAADALEAIAVAAEPVRHGTWEMRRKTIKTEFATLSGTYPTCSLCGHAEFGMYKSTPYCPNCGAKIDGGD